MDRSELIRRLVLDEISDDYAYLLSSKEPCSTEILGMPALDVVEEDFKTYFYITQKGRDLHLSDDTWWPFDNDDNPRE